jgi:hypothetical protein
MRIGIAEIDAERIGRRADRGEAARDELEGSSQPIFSSSPTRRTGAAVDRCGCR